MLVYQSLKIQANRKRSLEPLRFGMEHTIYFVLLEKNNIELKKS